MCVDEILTMEIWSSKGGLLYHIKKYLYHIKNNGIKKYIYQYHTEIFYISKVLVCINRISIIPKF